MKYIIPFLFFLLAVSCREEYSKDEVSKLLNRGTKEDLVKAFYLIGEKKDTSFIKEVVTNPYDPRVVHTREFYGISVYQSKMIALKKISGMQPPRKISHQPDSLIVNFYCEWLQKNTVYKCIML